MGSTHFRRQVSGAGWEKGLAAVALAVALAACGPGHGTDCLKSTGAIVTQRRALPANLETVTGLNNVDIKLAQGPDAYAEVRAGENLIDNVEFRVTGNRLDIANTSTCNWARSYDIPFEVTLHLPRVTSVFLKGQGNISTAGRFVQDTIFFHLIGAGDYHLDLQTRQLYLSMYELGDFNVQGVTEELNFTLGGNGRLFASGLQARRCYFTMNRDSNGNARVRATEGVGGTVAGTGTFYYAGRPPVTDFRITGRGRVQAE
jgi:hypothetical protein